MLSGSPRVCLTTGYDGTDFQGWQVQPGARTVQGVIEEALARLCGGQAVRIHASGRTDTGVHARGQTFHFDAPRGDFGPDQWRRALNALLPPDIRILAGHRAAENFHARFDARRKEYRYFVSDAEVMPPELRRTRVHGPGRVDLERMREACACLLGRHDFTAFSAVRVSADEDAVRTLLALSLHPDPDGFYLRAVADGFLYKMVRQIAGTLLRVGRGQLCPADLERMLREPARGPGTVTAPPQGLFLWEVSYTDASSGAAS
jgi:tRNA pseudouridine38-40 synthase